MLTIFVDVIPIIWQTQTREQQLIFKLNLFQTKNIQKIIAYRNNVKTTKYVTTKNKQKTHHTKITETHPHRGGQQSADTELNQQRRTGEMRNYVDSRASACGRETVCRHIWRPRSGSWQTGYAKQTRHTREQTLLYSHQMQRKIKTNTPTNTANTHTLTNT